MNINKDFSAGYNARSFDFKNSEVRKEEDLKNAGLEFEKMFLNPLFNQILNGDDDNAFFGESYGGKMWKSLFVEEIVNICAGRIGLSSMIEDSLSKKTNPYQKNNVLSQEGTNV